MKEVTNHDLIVFTDEDGMPWAAFVWGEADPAAVAALITPEVVEEQTGCDVSYLGDEISWPPRIQQFWMRVLEDGELYEICTPDAHGAERATGHRFYPQ